VRERAVGEEVIRSVSPGQQVIKIVHDALVELLGGDGEPEGLSLGGEPPVAILMAGLQGSGKTTTTAKLAKRISEREKKKVLVASLDTRRPAAMEQLAQMAEKAGVNCLPIVAGQSAVEIAKRAMSAGRLQGYDVVILDTAGRTSIDEEMMGEAAKIAEIARPRETLLVADALTGQDAVETAKRFNERLPLTGLALTRMDGDARGGAALSMRWVTGLPIKFLGVSAKRSTALMPSTPSAWPAAFWAAATSSRWWKRPPPKSIRTRLNASPRRWRRASSTSMTWPTSCASFRRWAAWAV
jgi:signal recognition particle subunit SRP54